MILGWLRHASAGEAFLAIVHLSLNVIRVGSTNTESRYANLLLKLREHSQHIAL